WSGAPTSFGYQWLRCDEAGANCGPIELASESGYTVVPADLGATLRVEVTAANAGGAPEPTRVTHTAVVTQPSQLPAAICPPTVGRSAQLSVPTRRSSDLWSGAPTSFGYQWLRCDEAGANCGPIELASESGYTVVPADLGATLRVEVTAA